MKAAVLYDYNTPLVVDDVELDAPRAGEVLVRSRSRGHMQERPSFHGGPTLGRSSQRSWATKAPA